MNWLKRFLGSTIGQKVLMALSGVALVLFVIGHMLGNLQIFIPDGGEALNAYAAALHSNMGLLWVARIGLIGAVVVHIGAATSLTLRSAAARPAGYKKKVWLGNDYPARTMRWGGVIVLAFVVYHLAHLTLGVTGPAVQPCSDASGEMVCHVYNNVIVGFANLPIAAFYIIAQLALGLHLAHGIWSGFRTLGLNNPRFDSLARSGGITIASLITLGNLSIPVAVQLDALEVISIFS